MRTLHRFLLFAVLGGLTLAGAACGESQNGGSGSAQPTAAAAEPDCSAFPKPLLERWGREKQLALNLSLAKGRNLKTLRETLGAPDPATFRTLGEAFDGFNPAGIEAPETFDAPDVIADDLHKTADLLQAALAAGGDTADPAWTALSEFYTQEFFVRHNGSISYYLREAGCI